MHSRKDVWCWCVLLGLLLPLAAAVAAPKAEQQRLLRQMWRGSQMERARAIDRLGRERVWQARPGLRKLLAQKRLSMRLRVSAILALGRLRDRSSHSALLRLAEGRYRFMTRISAIWALVKLQQRASLPGLIRILKKTKSRRIREYAVWAISSFKDRSTAKHLMPMLAYTHDACAAARRVLRKLGAIKRKVSCSRSARRKRRAQLPAAQRTAYPK